MSTSTSKSAVMQMRNQSSDEVETFTFFFRSGSPFSQWHVSSFQGSTPFTEKETTYNFSTCEQYMMFCKAVLFQDFDVGEQILKTSGPKKIKALGRKVKNFDASVWNQHKEEIVYQGNKYKFLQNQDLLLELLATQGTTLVEASPFDKIWGIGLSKSDPRAKSRSTWKGLNLLGQTLTRLRDDLSFQQKSL